MGDPPRVTVYSRTTCGLCDRAREEILAVREDLPFEYEEVFIDDDDELERAHGLRVPVVLLDGIERFEGEVEPRQLRELLARSLDA
jgi:glutaredoxin